MQLANHKGCGLGYRLCSASDPGFKLSCKQTTILKGFHTPDSGWHCEVTKSLFGNVYEFLIISLFNLIAECAIFTCGGVQRHNYRNCYRSNTYGLDCISWYHMPSHALNILQPRILNCSLIFKNDVENQSVNQSVRKIPESFSPNRDTLSVLSINCK